MKNLIAITVMVFAAFTSAAQDLDALWKAYDKARSEDRAKDKLTLLETIKTKSLAERRNWDYYHSCEEYASVRKSINWKDRDAANTQFRNEIENYGSAVLTFMYMQSHGEPGLTDFVLSHTKELNSSCTEKFHKELQMSYVFSDALIPLLDNDLDWALWMLARTEVPSLLKERLAGKYPEEAFLRLQTAIKSKQKSDSLAAFAKDFEGKAVALIARDELLSENFYGGRNLKEEDYLCLKRDAESLKSECQKLSGSERTIADCCRQYDSILTKLSESEVLSVNADYNTMSIAVRNLRELQVRLAKDGKWVFEKKLLNKDGSFYVPDTLNFDLPDMDDGEYEVECVCGRDAETFNYERYSLSISERKDSHGRACYVADARSGEPLKSFTLLAGDKTMKLGITDGFAYLDLRPDIALRARADNGHLRLSPPLRHYGRYPLINSDYPQSALILLNRAAFKPGETVRFKFIAYKGGSVSDNSDITAELRDARNELVAVKQLRTNEFGSAASEFLLEKGKHNGNWTVRVLTPDGVVYRKSLTVDEFVLPDFTVFWDEQDGTVLAGESVTLTGSVKAYSGHNLADVKMRCTLNGTDSVNFVLGEDGRFVLKFDTKPRIYDEWYLVRLTVTDGTGETHEFENSVCVHGGLRLRVTLKNKVEGFFSVEGNYGTNLGIVGDSLALVDFSVWQGRRNAAVSYSITRNGVTVSEAEVKGGGVVSIDLKDAPDGLYQLNARVTDSGKSSDFKGCFLKAVKSAPDVSHVFMEGGDDAILVGTNGRALWVVAELFDENAELLSHKIVKVEPGKELKSVAFPLKESYRGDLSLNVLSFKDCSCLSLSRKIKKREDSRGLSLSFSRFLDTTAPGASYVFGIHTNPSVEAAITIFDRSTEDIRENGWRQLEIPKLTRDVDYSCQTGHVWAMSNRYMLKYMSMAESAGVSNDSLEEAAEVNDNVKRVEPRQDFAPSVAWYPFLRPDKNGDISFSFTNSDRLSTYAVQVFVHDKSMRNKVIRKEMTVTLPVKVAIVEPRELHEEDRWQIRATLSNASALDVAGTVTMVLYDGTDRSRRIAVHREDLTVKAGGGAAVAMDFEVPQGLDTLGIEPSFAAEEFSDAVFVAVPVRPASQKITEAHSAIVRAGESRDSLLRVLKSQFVGGANGGNWQIRETSIADMLEEAVPEKITPACDNVLCLADAYLSILLARKLGAGDVGDLSGLAARIRECNCAGGGWAWFKTMNQSGIITLCLLDRFARISALDPDIKTAFNTARTVRWLDDYWFSDADRPFWCGRPTLEQYLNVRSMYPEVPFAPKADAKALKEFRKEVRETLTATRELSGPLLSKARRLSTLQNLLSLEGSKDLAEAWGISFSSRLTRSFKADVESLRQYTVTHRDGGMYVPNIVMPWRGLMDSELYAHTLVCRVLSYDGTPESLRIAEGIRLWMMGQKETQQWGDDPAYLDALLCVSEASPSTLATRVLAVFCDHTDPFPAIRPSGNGFTVSRVWLREDGSEIQEGDSLILGEKIRAEYRIWNGENRSFVRVSAPRPALLRPVDQLSGRYGWGFRPLRSAFVPQGWRTVLSDRTEFYFDSFPEEHTDLSEEFFVTQNGSFSAGAVVVESMYAPHYRACGEGVLLSTGNGLRL